MAVGRGREADASVAAAGGDGDRDEDGDADVDADADGDGDGDGGRNKEDLGARLLRLGEVVTSAGGRVGLLDRVRGLNGLLEGILEGRGMGI